MPQLEIGARHAVYATAHTLYASDQGRLVRADPVTLAPRDTPPILDTRAWTDKPETDDAGRLWALDQYTGDLVWFSGDERHSRPRAGTPQDSRLRLADDLPVILDQTRRTVEFLDPGTGAVLQSMPADLDPNDIFLVNGSREHRNLLITNFSRKLLIVCTYGADACAEPIRLGADAAPGVPVETDNHAIVPDENAGHVFIVDLKTGRIVVSQQLFDSPAPFELLTRDGVVFFNDPNSHWAGVIELDGRVRGVAKHDPVKRGSGATQVANSPDTSRQPPSGPSTAKPGNGSPVHGRGQSNSPGQQGNPRVGIVTKPRDRGVVGEEFELTAMLPGTAGIVTAHWTFGDGSEASGATVRHRWDHPGQFPVTVTTTLTNGLAPQAATTTVTIEPLDAPPQILQLNVEPEKPTAGQPVKFSAVLAGGRTDRWLWTVAGDMGEEARSNSPEFEHTFTVPGIYTLTLTAMAGPIRVQQSRQFTVAPEPPDVQCGDTLTVSATLKKDLVCPHEVAVTIAASDVVFDLGGHLLTTDSPTPTDKSTAIKVAGPKPITNVTIENGRITKYKTGISMTDTTGAKVSNVTVSSSSEYLYKIPERGADIATKHARNVRLDGVDLIGDIRFIFDDESMVTIANSRIGTNDEQPEIHAGIGARCIHGSECTVLDSDIRLWYLKCAEYWDSNSSMTILNSTIDASSIGGSCDHLKIDNSPKMHVRNKAQVKATSLIFTNNKVSSTIPESWAQLSGEPVHIANNTFSGMRIGAELEGTSNGSLIDNTFEGNSEIGLRVELGTGVDIVGNTFLHNGHGDQRPPDIERGGLIIAHSTLDLRDITVKKNNARHNSGYAIWVHPNAGNVDRGGNTTFDDELACFGVVCGPG